MLYLKFAHRRFNRSDETVGQVQDRQQSSPDVSLPSSSDFPDHDIPLNFDKITGVSTQSPPKSQQILARFSQRQNKATIATV